MRLNRASARPKLFTINYNNIDKYQTIGAGTRKSWPYEVAVHWPGTDVSGPIMLAEGTGYGAASGNFALSELLDAKWNENLEACNCGWLRDLAREEIARGEVFSADEIWERAQQR